MKKHLKIIFIACFILISLFASYSYSKYAYKTSQINLSEPETFMFVSDYEDGENYYVFMDQSTGTINVTVANYDLGLYAISDITSKVSLYTSDDVLIKASDVFTLEGNRASEKIVTLPIEINKIYKLQIESLTPFAKQIECTINGVDQNKIDTKYELVNHGDWVQLDLYVGHTPKDITIEYENYSPDQTNDLMRTWLTNQHKNTISASQLKAYSNYTFYFFGTYSAQNKAENLNNTNTITILD